jgi:glyoxylase-like metal-dependent hydrolase (beta-lactamase superfamily II)
MIAGSPSKKAAAAACNSGAYRLDRHTNDATTAFKLFKEGTRTSDMNALVQPTRRSLFAGASALAASAALPIAAFAKAPMQNAQAPAFYRFKIGNFEATVVSDGLLGLGPARDGVFNGVNGAEFSKTLTDNFLPTDAVELDQNVLVVNSGDKLALFDTGDGGSKMFGPKSGRLLANLKAAGYAPADFDAIVLTHAHPDHCWGLMGADGNRVFPNAQIFMAQADFDFWTDESKAQGDMMKPMIENTRKHLLPNRDRIVFIKDGQEFVPGIQAVSTPGHTVGHTSYLVTSGGRSLMFAGDVAHHYIVSVQNPRAPFVFDTDGQQGVASRLKTFDMLAAQRIPVLNYHFPWPGLGYIARFGDGYRYVPQPLQMTL